MPSITNYPLLALWRDSECQFSGVRGKRYPSERLAVDCETEPLRLTFLSSCLLKTEPTNIVLRGELCSCRRTVCCSERQGGMLAELSLHDRISNSVEFWLYRRLKLTSRQRQVYAGCVFLLWLLRSKQ